MVALYISYFDHQIHFVKKQNLREDSTCEALQATN